MSVVQDHWSYPSMKERVESEGVAVSVHLCLHYVRSDGEVSIRTVRVSHVLVGPSETYILGMCELRNERRVFRASKVLRAYQVQSPLSLAAFFHGLGTASVRKTAKLTPKPVVRISSSHYSIQCAAGKIYMSEVVHDGIKERLLRGDQESARTFLVASLPALRLELQAEVLALLTPSDGRSDT